MDNKNGRMGISARFRCKLLASSKIKRSSTVAVILLSSLALFSGQAFAGAALNATADTYLKSGSANQNQGTETILRVQDSGNNRVLVKFDQAQIAAMVGSSTIASAKLRFRIASNGNNWGTGRTVSIHRMIQNWSEGGATWNCPIDTNPSNSQPDCTQWNMTTSGQWPFMAATSTVIHTNNQSGDVDFDVSADIRAFMAGAPNYGWLIKKTDETSSGRIDYKSKEGGVAPSLIITLGIPPTQPPKFYDSYIKEGAPNQTFGLEAEMQVRDSGNDRVVIRIDQNDLAAAVGSGIVNSAKLRLFVTYNANNWGTTGRKVGIYRMTKSWAESQVTWNCPNDINLGNNSPDCPDSWQMSSQANWPFIATPTATFMQKNGQIGVVEWDVTNDVKAFLAPAQGIPNKGWLIKKVEENFPGFVKYSSAQGTEPPQLVLSISGGGPIDSDGDGVPDDRDAFPYNPAEWADLDHDGVGDNSDPDIDGDGFANASDAFPFDPAEHADLDGDGIGDNADTDRDGDGVPNAQDAFPNDPAESSDLDHDGIGDNADTDRDGDGVPNAQDKFPNDPTESSDIDNDGIGDNADPDRDGDGVPNAQDAFPNNPAESSDLDHDGIGDNSDPDRDGDGVPNAQDKFPNDPTESSDIDNDGIGDNADPDRDGDGVPNAQDVFPSDPTEWADLDHDGFGDNTDIDIDGDGVFNALDAFPRDPREWKDSDGDGLGDNSDPDRDNDGVPNNSDVFPDDPTESSDIDHDGIGDNADPDRDNDGHVNAEDAFPNDPSEWSDLDHDGIGDNIDPDRDGDGHDNATDAFPDDPIRYKLPIVKITSPGSLLTVGTTPLPITGTVDDPHTVVTVNGAPVSLLNGTFSANVNLTEGFNDVVVRAVDELGSEATASIVVSLDATPPYVTVQSPEDGSIVHSPSVSVMGLVNDIVRGTVSAEQGHVTVNGGAAVVSNRSYLAENVSLNVGANEIVISASDAVGNAETKTIHVTYVPLTGAKIVEISGNAQVDRIQVQLPQAFEVKLVGATGAPVADIPVIFRVIQGDGSLQAGVSAAERSLVVTTDANGSARTRFTLGSRAGRGNHRVSVSAAGFGNEIVFYASALPNPGDKVSVIAGNNQRGGFLSPLPSPFVVAVTDLGGNFVEGSQVSFEVVDGDGKLQNGQATYVATTDSDGRVAAILTLGTKLGLDSQRVVARLVGTDATAGFTASALMPGDPGQTRVSGVVLDNQDRPIPNATLRIQGTTREAKSDPQGQFTITQVPVGPVRLLADGSTTSRSGEWPTLSFDVVTVAGADNTLPAPIYLVPLNTNSAVVVGSEDVHLTLPEVPGFALDVKAGSVTFPDGSKNGKLSVTVVNNDKVPMPPPNGMQPQFIVTIQPVGARFDPPARLTIPNVDGHKPGAEVELYSYDHDLEEFVTIGWGTVSADGQIIKSNPGVGVVKAGWHCGSQPSGSGCCTGNGGGGGGCATCYKRENGQCTDKCVPDDSQSCEQSDPKNKCVTGQCRDGACKDIPIADGTSCYDADAKMNQCRIWQCKNGACDNSVFVRDGTNCDPYDTNECTTGICDQGACVVVPLGFPAKCDAGTNNECVVGQCQGTNCVATPVGDGAFCRLGGNNSCQVGSCQGGACTAQNVSNGISCNAGTVNACRVGGSCQDGSCTLGSEISCDDGNECTEDSCDAIEGCKNNPINVGACCAGHPYDTTTQGCCSGIIYELGSLCCTDGVCR